MSTASRLRARCLLRCSVLAAMALRVGTGHAQSVEPPPAVALHSLNVAPYLGTWYQVALFPNRFQAQCVSDTVAQYTALPDGSLQVVNRCRNAKGELESVTGLARPDGATLAAGVLSPAQLEVSFLPVWLRWLPIGWGRYWVVALADDGRYAVVSEPTREYLWVLSRQPRLAPADEAAVRQWLRDQGYDLNRLQPHTQLASAAAP